MPKVKVIYMEVEMQTAEDIADLLHLAMGGDPKEAATASTSIEPVAHIAPVRQLKRVAREEDHRSVVIPNNEQANSKPLVTGEIGLSKLCLSIVLEGPPRTSAEIFERLKVRHGYTGVVAWVYSSLHTHKLRMAIESRADDEAGGLHKWYPTKGNALG